MRVANRNRETSSVWGNFLVLHAVIYQHIQTNSQPISLLLTVSFFFIVTILYFFYSFITPWKSFLYNLQLANSLSCIVYPYRIAGVASFLIFFFKLVFVILMLLLLSLTLFKHKAQENYKQIFNFNFQMVHIVDTVNGEFHCALRVILFYFIILFTATIVLRQI